MRRGLLLSLCLGLLGLAVGCHHTHCHGTCDCQVYPIEHGTPCPWGHPTPAPAAAPAAPPVVAPVAAP